MPCLQRCDSFLKPDALGGAGGPVVGIVRFDGFRSLPGQQGRVGCRFAVCQRGAARAAMQRRPPRLGLNCTRAVRQARALAIGRAPYGWPAACLYTDQNTRRPAVARTLFNPPADAGCSAGVSNDDTRPMEPS